MHHLSHLTPDERERYAYLAGQAQLAELCEFQSQTEDLCSVEPHLSEARGCYMPEDFLHGPLKDLRAIAKRLRGENRAELERIAQAIEEARDEQARSSEYGRDELDKALDLIDL